jgi:RNA polymerase sigma-70 factor (ECF subfamily)
LIRFGSASARHVHLELHDVRSTRRLTAEEKEAEAAVDTALALRSAGGDKRALDELLRRRLADVYTLCYRITDNEQDAEDATQEALVSAARSIGRFRSDAKVSTWLYTIATNAAKHVLKDRHKQGALAGALEPQALARSSRRSVEREAIGRADITAAMRMLDPELRIPVILHEVGLSYREIANIEGITETAARGRAFRGRKVLAALLDLGQDAIDE